MHGLTFYMRVIKLELVSSLQYSFWLVCFKLLSEDPYYNDDDDDNNNNNNIGKEMQFQNDLGNKSPGPTKVLQKTTKSPQQQSSHISGTSLFDYQGNSRTAIRH